MNNEYKIEKGIPLPPYMSNQRYPFNDMEVGDSFLVPAKNVGGLRSSVNYQKVRKGRKFVVAQESPDVYRCWRTK